MTATHVISATGVASTTLAIATTGSVVGDVLLVQLSLASGSQLGADPTADLGSFTDEGLNPKQFWMGVELTAANQTVTLTLPDEYLYAWGVFHAATAGTWTVVGGGTGGGGIPLADVFGSTTHFGVKDVVFGHVLGSFISPTATLDFTNSAWAANLTERENRATGDFYKRVWAGYELDFDGGLFDNPLPNLDVAYVVGGDAETSENTIVGGMVATLAAGSDPTEADPTFQLARRRRRVDVKELPYFVSVAMIGGLHPERKSIDVRPS